MDADLETRSSQEVPVPMEAVDALMDRAARSMVQPQLIHSRRTSIRVPVDQDHDPLTRRQHNLLTLHHPLRILAAVQEPDPLVAVVQEVVNFQRRLNS